MIIWKKTLTRIPAKEILFLDEANSILKALRTWSFDVCALYVEHISCYGKLINLGNWGGNGRNNISHQDFRAPTEIKSAVHCKHSSNIGAIKSNMR